MSNTINEKHLVKLILLLIVSSLVIVGFLSVSVTSATELESQGLQIRDLPKGTKILQNGPTNSTEISHPFNLDVANTSYLDSLSTAKKAVYNYDSVYSFLAIVPDSNNETVVIANYLYEYNSVEQANQATESMSDELFAIGKSISLAELENKSELRGQAVSLTGDEEDVVYWFIGTKGNILYLVMANGMEASSVFEVFELAVSRLTEK